MCRRRVTTSPFTGPAPRPTGFCRSSRSGRRRGAGGRSKVRSSGRSADRRGRAVRSGSGGGSGSRRADGAGRPARRRPPHARRQPTFEGSVSGMAASRSRVYGCCGSPSTWAAGPYSTMRPRYITAMLVATYRTTARLCEMNSIDKPVSRCRLRTRLSTVPCIGHVECRGDLVGDDDLWPGGQRAGQGHALPLAAGQLRGIAPAVTVVETDEVEQSSDLALSLAAGGLTRRDHLADAGADGHARVEG